MPRIISSILLLLGLAWNSQAQNPNAVLNITAEDAPLSGILEEITAQSGYYFSFNARAIDTGRRLSFSVSNTSLGDCLTMLGEQINVAYQIIDDQIILKAKEEQETKKEELLTLSGFIEDGSSGESLIGATAAVPGTPWGAVTNAFGFYSLPLKRDKYQLEYSYVGYEKKEIDLDLSTDEQRNVSIQPQSIDLPNVIVELPALAQLHKKQINQLELNPNDLNNMPEFGGESGLVRGLQTLPGMQMHSDGSAFFYARGGERDQNLIIIDDAPIFNPSHLFGFYSIVIPEFAKSIQVYKSDVPANLGDRLSSIVDIRTKDGNLNKFSFSGALNPLINRFSLEAPIVKKKASVFVSWRRSRFEWLYRRAAPNADLSFGDFNFKLNYRVNDKNRLFFTTIISGDNFTTDRANNRFTAGLRWANLAATFRWNHIFGPKLFSNTTIYTGNYGYRLFFPPNHWQSALGSLSFKTDFTHYARPNYTARFGLEAHGYFIDPGSFALDSTIAILPNITPNFSQKTVLYYQGEWDLGERWQLKAGARLINWTNTGPTTYYTFNDQHEVQDTVQAGEGVYNRYRHLDPRLSLRYELNQQSMLTFSLGNYHQYLQLISDSQSPFTSLEVWLPAGPNIRPQSAFQTTLTYTRNLQAAGMEFSAAAYFKDARHQIDYKDHPQLLLNPLIEGELRFGRMQSYGLETMLKKDAGRLNGRLAYTYSRSFRRTQEVNGGKRYPAFQDRPHEFSLLLNYSLTPRTLLSGYFTIFSGSTFSSPTGFYTYQDQTIPVYGEKHNDRLPHYQRLDLAIKFRLNKDPNRRFQHSLSFSIYNILAHKNIVSVNFNKIPVEAGRPVVPANFLSGVPLSPTQTDLIRFFPSLSYKFNL
jgi:hypothetical protein